LMQLNVAAPKPVKTEGSFEPGQSPAAVFLGEKKTGGKVERGAEAFAKTLEKIQSVGEGKAVGGGSSRVGGKTDAKAEAKVDEKTRAQPAALSGELLELLSGLNEQQLIRVLMKINPEQLLQALESLGLDPAALLDAQSFADGRVHPSAEGKSGPGRAALVELLTRLSALVGQRALEAAITAVVNPKGRVKPNSGEATGQGRNQETGKERNVVKKSTVAVLDLRKEQPAPKAGEEQPSSLKSAFTLTLEKALESQDSLLFRGPLHGRAQTPVLEASASPSRPAPAFEQRFIPEFVKQTGIILKEGGNGEIRLVLKPDNLGSIRIRLAVSESSLEGRIVVDNNSVKQLVESSLDNLKNALRMEGYQTNLEVSVGHRRNGGGNGQTQPTVWSAGSGSEEFDRAVPLYLEMRPDYELVNVFA
jgi:flagellar hook-length control protein FliK